MRGLRESRLDRMQICQPRVPVRELLNEESEGCLDLGRRWHLHSLEGAERRDSDPDSVGPDRFDHGMCNLEWEPRPILDCTAVLIEATVGVALQELVEEITIRTARDQGRSSGSCVTCEAK